MDCVSNLSSEYEGAARVAGAGTAEKYRPIGSPFQEGNIGFSSDFYAATRLEAGWLAITLGELNGKWR